MNNALIFLGILLAIMLSVLLFFKCVIFSLNENKKSNKNQKNQTSNKAKIEKTKEKNSNNETVIKKTDIIEDVNDNYLYEFFKNEKSEKEIVPSISNDDSELYNKTDKKFYGEVVNMDYEKYKKQIVELKNNNKILNEFKGLSEEMKMYIISKM